jgi:hypothetical protein
MKGFIAYLVLLFVITSGIVHAQKSAPLLERTITISLQQERLDASLRKISHQGGFTFSYNSSVVDTDKIVSHNFVNKTVRQILDEIFNGSIEYKVRSKYIILTKAKNVSEEPDDKILTGYVVDEATGERVKNASVYDPITLSSAVTDSYGYFEIKLDKPATDVNLSVNKQNYSDTVVVVSSARRRLLNIPIKVDKKKFLTVADSVGEKLKRFWSEKILHPKRPELVNIRDTLHRVAQFSFVPFIGTNHLLSGNVVNDFSFNAFGGYAMGSKKFELGGLFNIDRGDVTGGQVAGLFNTVGGTMEGAQIAGLFNSNYNATKGGQVAGLANFNWNSTNSISAAGLFNFTNSTSAGFHFAGLSNITIGEQKGSHVAGLFNFSTHNAGPSQVAGLFNFTARDFEGSQIAGLWNFTARHHEGSQVAGLFNFSGGHLKGSQVAGILNYGTKIKGSQFGLVNISDSIRGVPVGLFSFVLKGYHKIEISADEVFYTNAAFRTGVHHFYNIFTAGAKPNTFGKDSTYWTFGYGLGTAPKISRKFYLNLDVTANQIMYGNDFNAINVLNKLYIGLDYQTTKAFSITLGVTLNGYITDKTEDGYKNIFTHYKPKILSDRDFGNDLNLKMWWGAKIGLRFL